MVRPNVGTQVVVTTFGVCAVAATGALCYRFGALRAAASATRNLLFQLAERLSGTRLSTTNADKDKPLPNEAPELMEEQLSRNTHFWGKVDQVCASS